jgi:hypothetical protein
MGGIEWRPAIRAAQAEILRSSFSDASTSSMLSFGRDFRSA